MIDSDVGSLEFGNIIFVLCGRITKYLDETLASEQPEDPIPATLEAIRLLVEHSPHFGHTGIDIDTIQRCRDEFMPWFESLAHKIPEEIRSEMVEHVRSDIDYLLSTWGR